VQIKRKPTVVDSSETVVRGSGGPVFSNESHLLGGSHGERLLLHMYQKIQIMRVTQCGIRVDDVRKRGPFQCKDFQPGAGE
jgi:hypothetical protein